MQNLYKSFVEFCYTIFGKSEKIHETDVNEETRLNEDIEHLEDGSLTSIQDENNKNDFEIQEKILEEDRLILDQKEILDLEWPRSTQTLQIIF